MRVILAIVSTIAFSFAIVFAASAVVLAVLVIVGFLCEALKSARTKIRDMAGKRKAGL
jgi:hypothetical protein